MFGFRLKEFQILAEEARSKVQTYEKQVKAVEKF